MSTATLYSLSAVAAVIAGICIILGTLLNDLLKTSRGTIFNFLGALIGLFGVTGLYLWQRAEAGVFGLVAYVLVFIGLALIACSDYFGAFILPKIPADQVAQLGESSVMQLAFISGFIFLGGEILFGISVIIAGVFSTIAAVLFMIGFPTTPLRGAYPMVTFIGLTISGIGLIWWGVSLWSLAGGS